MKRVLLTLVAFALLYSCTYNNVYINRGKDNKEGEAFINKFYHNIANENFGEIDRMVSDSLIQMAGPDGISKMVKFINSKVGRYKSYIIDDHYIRCIAGSNNETSYNYKLNVTYDKGTVEEIIGLRKQNGTEIKMYSYHANSNLLIH